MIRKYTFGTPFPTDAVVVPMESQLGQLPYFSLSAEGAATLSALNVEQSVLNQLKKDDFAVSGQYRGNGIGTQLLKTAEQYAQILGISKIVLHVEASNTAARRLYERFGFHIHQEQGTRYLMVK